MIILVVLLVGWVNQMLLAQSAGETDVLQFERDACKGFLEADPVGARAGFDRGFHAHAFQWRGEHTRE